MTELALDRLTYLPEPFVEWYRARVFQLAFGLSVIVHALLIALVPGIRTKSLELPAAISVELAPVNPEIPAKPVRQVKEPPPPPKSDLPVKVEPEVPPPPRLDQNPVRVDPVRPVLPTPQPKVEPVMDKVAKRPELVQPEPPRILSDPRPAPRAELPRVDPRPVERVEPRPEVRPDPQLEVRPVPRVEPRPVEPRVDPKVEVRPEPRVEPQRVAVQPPVEVPVPRSSPPTPAVPVRTASLAAPAPPVVPAQAETELRPKLETAIPVATPAKAPVVAAPSPPPAPVQPKKLPDTELLAREANLLVSYSQDIKRKVDEQKRYPKRALDAGWQGTTKVRVHLAADGSVMDVVVEEKSEHAVLDEAALKMVKNLKPFPPLPDELRGKERTIVVPIQFRIANS
jgi:TonB family protein